MKRLTCIFLIIFCPLSLARAETITLTLEQAVERAMKENYDINMAQERLNMLKAVVGEVRSGALPQVTASASYSRNIRQPSFFFSGNKVQIGNKNTYSSSVDLTQPLYEAGKVFKGLKAAQSERKKGEADLKDVQDEIKLNIKKTFYQILLMDKTIATINKTLKQMNEHLALIRKRYNEGLESDYALMRQEVEVSNIAPELVDAETARLALENALKLLAVLPEDSVLKLDGQLKFSGAEIKPESELISMAVKTRPDLTAASSRVTSLKQKVGVERGGYLPTLGITSNLAWQAQTDDFGINSNERYYSLNAGLALSWPIFDGFKTHYRIKEAKTELKIASEDENKKRAETINDVKNARSQLLAAAAREKNQKKALALAEKAVKIAGMRFNEGLMGQLELNDTIIARDRAERLYSQAVYDCLAAMAELERAAGGKL